MGVATGVLAARAGRVRGGSAARGVDLRDRDLGALLRKSFGGGAADAAAATGDEGDLARQTRHETSPAKR